MAGQGTYLRTPEILAKQSAAHTGYTHSAATIAKQRASATGKTHSEETKAKIRDSKLGVKRSPFTEEHKRHISEGVTVADRSFVTSTGYPLSYYDIQPLIRDRDRHICQLCSEPEGDEQLSVHHIDKDKLNSDSFNLVSLCRPCHIRVHERDK